MNKSKQFAAVLFDVDGTIIDNHSFHEEAWLSILQDWGKPITREEYLTKYNSRTNAAILTEVFEGSLTTKEIEEYTIQKEERYKQMYRPHLKAREGFLELLRKLKEMSYPVAAVSNAPRGNVFFALEGLNILNQFDLVLGNEDVVHGKPDPSLYLLAAKMLNVPISECLIFEDSVAGIKAAKASGAKFIVLQNIELIGQEEAGRDATAFIKDFTTSEKRLLEIVFS